MSIHAKYNGFFFDSHSATPNNELWVLSFLSGSGGINLDSYADIKAVAQSGQLLPVVTNTNPNSTMMPPPPYQHLDTCQIKALTQWINQGYQNN